MPKLEPWKLQQEKGVFVNDFTIFIKNTFRFLVYYEDDINE